MIVTQKDNTFREKGAKSILLVDLVKEYAKYKDSPFIYMGTEASNLNGVIGLLKIAQFELLHLLRLRPMLPGTLKSHIAKEKAKYDSVAIRNERGKVIFDYHQMSFILNRNLGSFSVEKQRFLAERVAEVPYWFTPGSRGIWFDDRYYFTWDAVELVASNEYAFAVAGGNTIQIFDNGYNYTISAKAKQIRWGPEGLYFVNQSNELELIK